MKRTWGIEHILRLRAACDEANFSSGKEEAVGNSGSIFKASDVAGGKISPSLRVARRAASATPNRLPVDPATVGASRLASASPPEQRKRHVISEYALVLAAGLWAATAAAAQAEENPLGMVTGPETGTYIAIGKDIAKVVANEGGRLEIKSSAGSIDNIRRITEAGENAGLGIVQSDVLGFLKRSRNPRSQQIAARLRLIFPFYAEEVHVLARGDVKDFKGLDGKRVAIGQPGSGNMLTAMNLFAITGVKPARMLQLPPDQGVVAVLAGEADAVIFVAGKPVTLFSNLEQVHSDFNGKYAQLLNQVHFLPVTGAEVEKEYDKAEITPQDYDFVQETVPTASVTSLLVAYDFSSGKNDYYRARCNQLKQVGHAIRSNLGWLKENGHPKWKEVEPYRTVALWQRDACAWRQAELETPRLESELERDLLGIIQRTQTGVQ